MKTYYIFDIDTTLANNDERAKLLRKHCVVCGAECSSSDGSNRPGTWFCNNCGITDVTTPQSNWDSFTNPSEMYKDLPIPEAQRYMRRLINSGNRDNIHFITGRKENCRIVTEQWLSEHYDFNPSSSHLMMRPMSSDSVPASIFKEKAFLELKDRLNSDLNFDTFYFFEDDKYVFSMYEKYGTVMQSPEIFSFICVQGSPRHMEQRWNR